MNWSESFKQEPKTFQMEDIALIINPGYYLMTCLSAIYTGFLTSVLGNLLV
jgi:hypothetical protein